MTRMATEPKRATEAMGIFKAKLTEAGIKTSNCLYGLIDKTSKEKILDRISFCDVLKADLVFDPTIVKHLKDEEVTAQVILVRDFGANASTNFVILTKGPVFEVMELPRFVKDYVAKIQEFRL